MQALLDRPLSDRAASVSLSVAWVLVALIANPVAELPLNDDWAYSLPVKSWVEQGDLRLTFWQSMPLLPQLGWGALFCLPFGFSFTALRVSTLVLGGLGVGLAFRLFDHACYRLHPLARPVVGSRRNIERLRRAEAPERVRLLAPFDPLVWDRRRFELFWGWAYRFEAYTPASHRVRGYYALPMLWRDQVIGWANLSISARELTADLGFIGKRPADAAFKAALDAELQRMRDFLHLES